MREHITADELADAGLGLVDDGRADQIAAHLQDCPACADRAADLAAVEQALAAVPVPPMPADVMARLDAVVAAEQQRRAGRVLAVVPRRPHQTLGALDTGPARRPFRVVRTALVAAVAALAVGFGGYVVSASAGLGDPIGSAATQVSSAELADEARDLLGAGGLSAHVFSPSWWCANRVVKGRITGLTQAVVDGTPALLVYSTAGGVRRVTVVQGCPQAAVAGTSVTLNR